MRKSIMAFSLMLLVAFAGKANAAVVAFQITASAGSVTLVPGTSYTLSSTIKNTGTLALTFPTLSSPDPFTLISSGPGFILVPQDTVRNLNTPAEVSTSRGPNVLGFHADIFGVTLPPGESFTYIYQVIDVLSPVTLQTSLDFGALLIPDVPQGIVPPSVQADFIRTPVVSIPIRSGTKKILGSPVTVRFPTTTPRSGDLDTSFGFDGKVFTDFGNRGDTAVAIAIQPDGKIVVAGDSTDASGNEDDFAIARYLPDGALDTTFSGDGKVRTNLGAADLASAVALQPDGKIVVAETSVNLATLNGDFVLARYLPNGTLDTTFSGNGWVKTDLGANDGAAAVALQPDGKILVAGGSQNGNNLDFALARYLPNSSLDLSFGGGGIVTSDFSAFDRANALILQRDGKIVVAGVIGDDFGVARYLPNGALDMTFNGAGWVSTSLVGGDQATEVALQRDGKIVLAGFAGSFSGLARYRADGTLDPTFGDHGKVLLRDFVGSRRNQAYDLALQPDGEVVIAGSDMFPGGHEQFTLARFFTDCTLMAASVVMA